MKLHGLLLLDKPSGITSNQALQKVKKLLTVSSKAGHTGSLDPLATGLLPICFGEATKFSRFLLDSDKKYQVTMQLGIKTTTADLDGAIIARNDNIQQLNISAFKIIQEILPEFIGESSQVPPIYSAIKINGVRSYKLARNHEKQVLRSNLSHQISNLSNDINYLPERRINIYDIKLLNICNLKKQITLEVHCSKGTYIRSLVEDLGKKLNCFATVIELRRIAIGKFAINNRYNNYIFNLEELNKKLNIIVNDDQYLNINKLLLPIKDVLNNLPQLIINYEQAVMLFQGKVVYMENINASFKENQLVSIFFQGDEQFLGVGEINNNCIISKRLVDKGFIYNLL